MIDIASEIDHLQSLLSQIAIGVSLPQINSGDLREKVADCFAPLVRIQDAIRKPTMRERRRI